MKRTQWTAAILVGVSATAGCTAGDAAPRGEPPGGAGAPDTSISETGDGSVWEAGMDVGSEPRADVVSRTDGATTDSSIPVDSALSDTQRSPGDAGTDANADAGMEATPLRLDVYMDAGVRAISPLIYGIHAATHASAMKAKLVGLGYGSSFPTYNWEINATNGGRPTVPAYANVASGGDTGPASAVKQAIEVAAANHGSAVISVPIGDWVAADKDGTDVRGADGGFQAARFKHNRARKGAPLALVPDRTDDSVYQDEFTNWVKQTAASDAGTGVPILFELDNQPELWWEDHNELYSRAQVTYDNVVTRGIQFASSIKSVWPEARVGGPVSYGWLGFMNLQNSPDEATKGNFLEYYLDRMKLAQADAGARLLDYVDLHWWPQVTVGGIELWRPDASPAMVAARLQAPRSLWDGTYREHSYIDDFLLGGTAIRLIPRLRTSIDAHYAGMPLAITAWYFGGGGDISGALATADVLGIFGSQGVDASAIALSDGDDSYTLAAFRSYLDYDGAGAHFGDTSVRAEANDIEGASFYASYDSTALGDGGQPTGLKMVALNKRDVLRTAVIRIQDAARSYTSCEVYRLVSDLISAKLVHLPSPLTPAVTNTFVYALAPMSVSVIDCR